MKRQKVEDLLLSQEFQIAAYRVLHGVTPSIDPETVAAFAGTYELYKPAHDRPENRINVARLIIGEAAKVDGAKTAFRV